MTEIEFAGLCVVLHRVGGGSAEIVLLDPRSVGGETHSPCIIAEIDEEETSIPDETFYGLDGLELGFWSLRGAVVTFPVAHDPFTVDLSPIGHAPTNLDDPNSWRSLRWLPEFFGPSAASQLSDRRLWPTQASVVANHGKLVAKMPHDKDKRRDTLIFKEASGPSLTEPRARAMSCALEFEGPVTIVIDAPLGRRILVVRKDKKAVISNTSATSGGHEDTSVLQLLAGSQLKAVRREVRTGGSGPIKSNPDICDTPLILYP